MNTPSDPVLRALQTGNEACPDGPAIARLGAQLRAAAKPPQPVDLRAAVLAASHTCSADELIDGQLAGDPASIAADPELHAICTLAREAAQPPQPIDLPAKVLNTVHSQRSSRRLAIERPSRWRTWTLVAAGHIAALLLLGLMTSEHDNTGNHNGATVDVLAAAQHVHGGGSFYVASVRLNRENADFHNGAQLPAHLPKRWQGAHRLGVDLFAVRRDASFRQLLRTHYHTTGSTNSTRSALNWLIAQQDESGQIAADIDSNDAVNIGGHALALLAILGEGADDPARYQAALHACTWLCNQSELNTVADETGAAARTWHVMRGYAALALVESAALLGDTTAKETALQILNSAATSSTNRQRQSAELGGAEAAWMLAINQATALGWQIDPASKQWAHRHLNAVKPNTYSDIGTLGMATFARQIAGRSNRPETQELLTRLSNAPLADQAPDPLAWWLPTLAMREAGGEAWLNWSNASERALLVAMVDDKDGTFLPAQAAANSAGSDVIATAAAVLNLQAAYRYLPLAW